MAQQQAIHKFILGSKELEGKNAEFQYDRGVYTITDVVGEERTVIYKSRNAQEAYTKWNVYIGRKKERPQREYSRYDNERDGARGQSSGEGGKRDFHKENRHKGGARGDRQGDHTGDRFKEESRKHFHKKNYGDDFHSQQGGHASKNDSYGGKKKNPGKNKFKRDRRPRGEYKRSNNKIRDYRMEEE